MRTHTRFMKKCIELGKEAMQNGNPPVGSIIVIGNTIIGIGKEAGVSGKDVTKHAEIEAIRNALIDYQELKGVILYTTHEPCIMCSYVIRHYKIKTIIFGAKSKYIGGVSSKFNVLETGDNPSWKNVPEVIGGILENECHELSKAYKLLKVR